MQCQNCDRDFEQQGDCPYCGAVPELKTRSISAQERDEFQGITIIDNPQQSNYDTKREKQAPNSNFYFKKISFGSGFFSILFILAFILLLFFVALPILLLLFLAGGCLWLFKKIFS